MASSHLPSDPQALELPLVDLDSIKPWPRKPWPTQPKPTTARSQAWLSSINLASKTLRSLPEQVQHHNSRDKLCKKLRVQVTEPASSHILAHLVKELYNLQDRPLPIRSNDPLTEADLLNLLYVVVDKQRYTVGRFYRSGTEHKDSHLVNAAAHYLKSQRTKARASTNSQHPDLFLAASLHSSEKHEPLSKPVESHQPVVATAIPTKKRKFDPSSDQEKQHPYPFKYDTLIRKPFVSSYNQKNQRPSPFKHTRSTLKPCVPSISNTAQTTHISAHNDPTHHPSPQQPQRKLKTATLDFGNRIEQSMLKIEKWADSWLSGAMPHTDLAWDSFEFCLCMPDILEEGEVVERG